MTDQNTQKPSVAPQPTSQDISKPTINDNTSALKTKVDTSKAGVKKQEPCPRKDTGLQFVKSNTTGWKTSGDGFSITEYNPPKLKPKAGKNGGPAVGAPNTATPYQDIRCGNLLEKNIDFKCSLVSDIKLKSCMFQFEATIQNYIDEQMKIALSYISGLFPSADYFIKMANTICKVFNEFQRVMCVIQQVIECIMSTIQFITGLISWALSLPMTFLSQLMTCVTSFLGGITGSLSDLMKGLASVSTAVLDCKSVECAAVSSVFDIGDTAAGAGSDFAQIDDIWNK